MLETNITDILDRLVDLSEDVTNLNIEQGQTSDSVAQLEAQSAGKKFTYCLSWGQFHETEVQNKFHLEEISQKFK